MVHRCLTVALALCVLTVQAFAFERPDVEFKKFQFQRNMIPGIDAKTDDWDMVGDEYKIRTDQLSDTKWGHGTNIDTNDIDVTVRVGWVKGRFNKVVNGELNI